MLETFQEEGRPLAVLVLSVIFVPVLLKHQLSRFNETL